MVKVQLKTSEGQVFDVEEPEGTTLMEAAVRNNVPGIDGECGGGCTCATCHVYIDTAHLDKCRPATEMEQDMLDFALDVQPNSRLSCQIDLKDTMDGMLVQLPAKQA